MSINRVNITGNLTRDPELRSTAGGMAVLGFGVAVNDRRKNQQTGQWEDYPNFVDCTMFGNRAEALSRILRKGMKVAIEGKLRYSSWEDKNGGGRRSKIEIIPDEVELLSQNANAQQPQQYAPQGYQPQVYAPQQAPQQAYQPQPAPQQVPQQWNAQQAYQNPPAAPQPRQQAPAPAPQAYAPQQAPQALQQAPQQPVQQSMDVYDEDIPF
ncbi:single-stranded DNA-binding protein [uncultured Senegalimassilia sp.]|uniref:single-stranded DNA-binding protein n=1 Tax=uncultured Senegalimassilia sp. TaxID=1714350 RepID=UPI0027DD15CF|nr:single-stranded DNA-binding protein [uncultured Senegalimassilia sp.]